MSPGAASGEKPRPTDMLFWYVLVGLATAALFWQLLLFMVFRGLSPDFPWHDEFIAAIRNGHLNGVPHFLYHVLVLALQLPFERVGLVAPGDYRVASFVVALAAIEATAMVLLWRVSRLLGTRPVDRLMAAALSVGLLLAHPLCLLVFRDNRRYLGYLAPNVYHSPTLIVAKPLALAALGFVLRAFAKAESSWRSVLACAVMIVLSALAKPSFLLPLLPLVVLVGGVRLMTGKVVDIRLLLLGVLLPGVAILAVQYRIAFDPASTNQIIVAPLAAMHAVSSFLGLKFVLSVLFPVAAYVLWIERARGDFELNFTWGLFLASLPLAYLLAESGRVIHGNLVWSAHLTLFLLFVESALFTLRRLAEGGKPAWRSGRFNAVAAIFVLHVASGTYYQRYMIDMKQEHPEALPLFARAPETDKVC